MRNGKSLLRLIEHVATIKPLLVAMAFSPWLVLLYLGISGYVAKLVQTDQNILQSFIEWFGTAYSLFLALVMVNVWDQFNTVENEFDREVDAIATLYQTAKYALALDPAQQPDVDSFREDIKGKVIHYLRHVITNYQIEHVNADRRHEGNGILESIGLRIGLLGRDRLIIEPLVSELFESLSEAMDVRGDRIAHSKQRMPKTVWLVAIFASVVWLLPFLALQINDTPVAIILTSGVTFVILIVLIIINDFNGPFDGTWKIELENWNEFLESLDPATQVIFVCKSENWFLDLLGRVSNGKLPFLPKCPLSYLAHKGWSRHEWEKFIERVEAHRLGNDTTISCEAFHLSKFKSQPYYKKTTVSEYPAVILKRGDVFDVLLDARKIERCTSLVEFDELFHCELAKYISWN